jgi:hypothetical protein
MGRAVTYGANDGFNLLQVCQNVFRVEAIVLFDDQFNTCILSFYYAIL